MKVTVDTTINGSKESVWKVITDIKGSEATIEDIEVLDEPDQGLVGLKWRETRTMFGKQATEVMWITDAVENESYQTRAESHGAIYISRLAIAPVESGCQLTFEFDGTPVKLATKIIGALTGFMFKGATAKALRKNLEDIKNAVEGST